jgi:hypothetical protein
MKFRFPLPALFRSAAGGLFALILAASPTRAEWQRDEKALAWKSGDAVVWQFNFDPASSGKPFFHPLGAVDGANVTARGPIDHPWHYGLWFSWKYINGKNYWEEDRVSGKPAGKTAWTAPVIATEPDGSATIKMALTYINHDIPRVDIVESREIAVSAPDAAGSYTIDWKARFIAGPDGALLDRTPMPGEPRGANNGGYAGMSIRMDPATPAYVSTEGPVTTFTADGMPGQTRPGDRARPNVPAMGFNFSKDGKTGSIAFLSDPKNSDGKPATWYLINTPRQNPPFHFADQTVLAPKPIQLAPGEKLELRYRFILSRAAQTPESLKAAFAAWPAEKPAATPAAAAH